MKTRFPLGTAITVLLLLALSGCSLWNDLTGGVSGSAFKVSFNASLPAHSLAPDRQLVPAESLQLAFAVKGHQSGVLVAGKSDNPDEWIEYYAHTLGPTGEVWGHGGTSEPYTAPSPDLSPTTVAGTTVTPEYGVFMVRSSASKATDLLLEKAKGTLSAIDEVVLRLAPGESQLISSLHFVGNDATYAMETNNLTINGNSLDLGSVEYVMFAPASIVGAGFSALVTGNHTVADPVLGDEMAPVPGQPNSSTFVNDESTWTEKPDWINDSVGNGGLFAMIDAIAGVAVPSDRTTSAKWQATAKYFQHFFAKFYRAGSTMCNINGGLGNSGHSGFILIALDDSAGPISLASSSQLSVTFQPQASTFGLDAAQVLDVSGSPPLSFVTTVTQLP